MGSTLFFSFVFSFPYVEYRAFFSEIARYSPACGLAQLQGNEKAVSILRAIAEGSLDAFLSQNYKELEVI